ncbi:LacI family DNA-binding transcriptional regulator [Brachyspira hyodysenteriae]|uniref:Transcriptional regulator n=1 Tax=Brachyspira hyodysenteriae (strain ATCC 49526 / WA1) TaxID=565034 RepID=A0A3B6VC28_BRAHW|nr:LacI family DNA-binding transcriptional regulator [Brachyspira hyodysenteriae]ACN82931.1 transcriptional regulator [Brachyspira hyodysenteriae WA1]AUJ48676.1 LacI family transcriptional regulator [Brachyspira hyodysenteriae]KLI47988.1 LacI family transcriptional regulator [Brachyspira hyodysenteriae]MDA0022458.1 LacI family DNA-binding transcriptional regulator [Brachyspira hyodysenteriae]MDA0079499.1 LacI family DNA-binding transcriptional regulator [Brachyspira hyodysenteriae]
MATIREIAKLAGVSIGTVDRALNNRGRIDHDVEQKILDIAKSLNYKPDKIAKSLAIRKKKFKIAAVLNTYNNLFFEDVIRGIEIAGKEIEEFGMSIIIKRCKDFDADNQLELIEEAINEGANAMAIVAINDERVKNKISELYNNNFPIVLLNSFVDSKDCIAYVGCNYDLAGEIAASLLNIISNGNNINLLVFSNNFNKMLGNKKRVDSLVSRLNSDYKNVNVQSIIEMEKDNNLNFDKSKNNLLKHMDTDVVICPGAETSKYVINAIKELGLYNKIKIITYDCSDVVKEGLLDRGIVASITQNPQEQGYRAIKVLFEYLLTKTIPDKRYTYIETQVIFRENLL